MENSLFQKKSQSPQTGQVYFNIDVDAMHASGIKLSQSPQTGQVYFNCVRWTWRLCMPKDCLNPLKRVKFISI